MASARTEPTLDELVAGTPPDRDRYMDFLRAASILVVVVGHWMIGNIFWRDGVIGTTSAIGVTPWLWLATWFLQVMPIFFFVGGFSNLVSLRSFHARGRSTGAWLRTRLERLLVPSLVFMAVWMVVQAGLHITETGASTTPYLRGMKPPGATVPFGPLWFLAVYAAVIALSPAMLWLHSRFGGWVIATMLVGSVAADTLGFAGGVPLARWANVAFVFLIPHQLGFFYAEGRLGRLPRAAFAAMALVALAALILLTNPWIFGEVGQRWFPGIGHYPRSLLGTDVQRISNAYPPTLPFMAMVFWSLGLAMLLRGPATRWLRRTRPWKGVIVVNSVIMTLFLWHMTAFLLTVLALWPLGLGQAQAPSAGWWLQRPLWVLVPGVILLGLIRLFARFEARAGSGGTGGRGRCRSARPPPGRPPA
jgi:fucose 4-O-acetylase-like acetyltransferase